MKSLTATESTRRPPYDRISNDLAVIRDHAATAPFPLNVLSMLRDTSIPLKPRLQRRTPRSQDSKTFRKTSERSPDVDLRPSDPVRKSRVEEKILSREGRKHRLMGTVR